MELNKKKFDDLYYLLTDIQDYFKSNACLLFLYGGKPSFECYTEKNPNEFAICLGQLLCSLLKKKVYMEIGGLESGKYCVLFSKSRIKKIAKPSKDYKKNCYQNGKRLGIPECCLKKYCDEEDKSVGTSVNSVKRYLKQCEGLKVKEDKFGVFVANNGGGCDKFGFVPCHPNCPKALKIVEGLEKIEKEMERWT